MSTKTKTDKMLSKVRREKENTKCADCAIVKKFGFGDFCVVRSRARETSRCAGASACLRYFTERSAWIVCDDLLPAAALQDAGVPHVQELAPGLLAPLQGERYVPTPVAQSAACCLEDGRRAPDGAVPAQADRLRTVRRPGSPRPSHPSPACRAR